MACFWCLVIVVRSQDSCAVFRDRISHNQYKSDYDMMDKRIVEFAGEPLILYCLKKADVVLMVGMLSDSRNNG